MWARKAGPCHMAVPSSQSSISWSTLSPSSTWHLVCSNTCQLPWTASGDHNLPPVSATKSGLSLPTSPTQGNHCGRPVGTLRVPSYWFTENTPLVWALSGHCNTLYPRFSSWNCTHVSSWSSTDYTSSMSLTGLKSRCPQGRIPFWRLQDRTHLLARSSCQKRIPFLVVPSSIFKISNTASVCLSSVITSSSDSCLPVHV